MDSIQVKVDLEAYSNRIGYAGPLTPSLDVLRALHLAHATHIPFENLDVLLKRPIKLDLVSLQAKLVTARRGGYCFEQNSLFWRVLEQIGFDVTPLAARVRSPSGLVLPRTHMLLLIRIGDAQWLADVGFGGDGPLQPVPLDGNPVQQLLWSYRTVEQAGGWELQVHRPQGWSTLYSFTAEPQRPADYEMANYYVSTHPDSRFVQTLTAQLPSPTQRLILRQRELTIDRGTSIEVRTLGNEELFAMLRDSFGLPVDAGMRLDQFLG